MRMGRVVNSILGFMKINYKRMKQRRRAEAKAARAELAARAAAKTHESTVAEVVDMAEARCDAMTAWALQGTSGTPVTGTMELEEAARYSLRCRKASLEELRAMEERDGKASGFGMELVVDPATMETSWRPLAAGALWSAEATGKGDGKGTGRNACSPLGSDGKGTGRNACSPLWRLSEVAWAVRCDACARVWRLLRWRLGLAARKVAVAVWAAVYLAAFGAVFALVGAAVAWCAAVEEDCDAAKAAAWRAMDNGQ